MLPNAPAEAVAQGKKLPKIAAADAAMIKNTIFIHKLSPFFLSIIAYFSFI